MEYVTSKIDKYLTELEHQLGQLQDEKHDAEMLHGQGHVDPQVEAQITTVSNKIYTVTAFKGSLLEEDEDEAL